MRPRIPRWECRFLIRIPGPPQIKRPISGLRPGLSTLVRARLDDSSGSVQKLVFGRVSGLPRECTVLEIPVAGHLFHRQPASVGPTVVSSATRYVRRCTRPPHFERFLRDSGCIARPQRQEFVNRSGVSFRETPLQIESIPTCRRFVQPPRLDSQPRLQRSFRPQHCRVLAQDTPGTRRVLTEAR